MCSHYISICDHRMIDIKKCSKYLKIGVCLGTTRPIASSFIFYIIVIQF